jgi:hypothetical protein
VLAERRWFAGQLIGVWVLLVAIDALLLRGAGTGAVHAAFSVLHDPATTLTYLALVPAVIYTSILVLPVDLLRRIYRQHKPTVLAMAVFASAAVLWWTVQDVTYSFCVATPYPEDLGDLTARAHLAELQSNYWAAFVANSNEDMLAAKQDFIIALTQARSGDCGGIADFLRLTSVRAKLALVLTGSTQLLLVVMLCVLLAHYLLRTRVERRFVEGLTVVAAVLSIYPLLAYYSDWYMSFGETVVDRPVATIAGFVFGSSALFLLGSGSAQPRLWQRLAQSLAATGLIANLLCVVWPQGFVHGASHFAIASLAVVLFVELLLAAWVGATVKLFTDTIARPA